MLLYIIIITQQFPPWASTATMYFQEWRRPPKQIISFSYAMHGLVTDHIWRSICHWRLHSVIHSYPMLHQVQSFTMTKLLPGKKDFWASSSPEKRASNWHIGNQDLLDCTEKVQGLNFQMGQQKCYTKRRGAVYAEKWKKRYTIYILCMLSLCTNVRSKRQKLCKKAWTGSSS